MQEFPKHSRFQVGSRSEECGHLVEPEGRTQEEEAGEEDAGCSQEPSGKDARAKQPECPCG